jgi:hypothetical protein
VSFSFRVLISLNNSTHIKNIAPEGFTAETMSGLRPNIIQAKYNRLWFIRHYKGHLEAHLHRRVSVDTPATFSYGLS